MEKEIITTIKNNNETERHKSDSYMEIYESDSESMKQLKIQWNKRIDEIKRDI